VPQRIVIYPGVILLVHDDDDVSTR